LKSPSQPFDARWTLVPDPRFAELEGALEARMALVARMVQPETFGSLLDPLMRDLLSRGFADAGAHEGTVWLPDSDGQHLVPAFNTGVHADQFVGTFRQPLSSGLICMVYASEQSIVENEVQTNAGQSKLLDNLLAVETHAMMAVPFQFLRGCRGVVSCVQLRTPGAPVSPLRPFTAADLTVLQRTSSLCGRLLELRLLSHAVGWPL
jgi:hypothetical protein